MNFSGGKLSKKLSPQATDVGWGGGWVVADMLLFKKVEFSNILFIDFATLHTLTGTDHQHFKTSK